MITRRCTFVHPDGHRCCELFTPSDPRSPQKYCDAHRVAVRRESKRAWQERNREKHAARERELRKYRDRKPEATPQQLPGMGHEADERSWRGKGGRREAIRAKYGVRRSTDTGVYLEAHVTVLRGKRM